MVDMEIPMDDDIRMVELVLRGALVGEVMTGNPSLERIHQLVSSLSLLTSGWKIMSLPYAG
jgi:hypothetical protein